MENVQGTKGNGAYKVIGTRPIRHDGEDKVTGRAQYGGDVFFSDLLHGKVLRSPHAHARIVSMDVSRARALPGVRAVVTSSDLPRLEDRIIDTGEGIENLQYMTDRILASGKVLFKGHPVAAVAADDPWTAEEACSLIDVQYEVLKPVTDVLEAMAPGAPLLHGTITTTTLGKKERADTNVCLHIRHQRGDLEAGFKAADVVIEREFRTKTVHQGYIELHGCTALAHSDGQITIWTSTQGIFPNREQVATILKVPLSRIKVVPMEIGGGFGGKIPVYLEPVAALLSQKTGKPVRLMMTRSEEFQASGPTSSTFTRIKIGCSNDGRITAASAWMAYEAGAFPGDWSARSVQCVFSPYKLDNLLIDSFDVMTNTTKVAAYRAPASPQAMWGVESVMDEVAQKLNMDPLDLRMVNAVQEGDPRMDGLPYPRVGLKEVIAAAKESDHYRSPAPSGPYQGRGVALGFWFNAGLQSSALVTINHDGTANVITGSVDIGGSRASMAMIAAETLGLRADQVRPSVADTDSIGHTDVTGGSRTTTVTGTAVYQAACDALEQMKQRVAKLWDCQVEHVEFRDGAFRRMDHEGESMTVQELAPRLPRTGGPVMGRATYMPRQVAGTFGCHIADIEVDPTTGKTKLLRYTAVQDVGTAIHPAYVEGQMTGGALQGIGWALNEEYMRNDKGEMLNPGFLDYRMPTMLDFPRVETILVEVPNPLHPYGVRGVGETPIVPPLGALHNAVARATGLRLRELPMSPPVMLQALEDQGRTIA